MAATAAVSGSGSRAYSRVHACHVARCSRRHQRSASPKASMEISPCSHSHTQYTPWEHTHSPSVTHNAATTPDPTALGPSVEEIIVIFHGTEATHQPSHTQKKSTCGCYPSNHPSTPPPPHSTGIPPNSKHHAARNGPGRRNTGARPVDIPQIAENHSRRPLGGAPHLVRSRRTTRCASHTDTRQPLEAPPDPELETMRHRDHSAAPARSRRVQGTRCCKADRAHTTSRAALDFGPAERGCGWQHCATRTRSGPRSRR